MQGAQNRGGAIQIAGVDWAARWRDVVEQREARRGPSSPSGGSRWDGRAGRFARLADELDASADL